MYTLEDDDETSSRFKRHMLEIPKEDISPDPEYDSVTEKIIPGPKDPQSHGFSGSHSFSQSLSTLASAAPGTQKGALAALVIACCAVFFTALDQTVVVTALPQIITDLQIPLTRLDQAAWIISAYLLGFVVAMPLMGRVSDIYGRRRIFLLCLTIFGAGSLLCGLAPWLGQTAGVGFLNVFDTLHLHVDTSSPGLIWLIAARLLQASGGGAVVPVAMAIASDFYGQERRALALGIIGAVTEAGGALGPLYGALVVEHLGWQAIFYLNIPIVLALIAIACFLIPRGQRLHEKIDWLGALLLGLALTCLSLGLAQQGTSLGPTAASGQAPQNNLLALLLAAAFLLAFIVVELRARWPIITLAMFKRVTFSAASLVSLLVGAALIIALTDIPIFVDTVLQLPVLDSGLALLRLTIMIPVGAVLGGWLCNRISCRVTGILGLLFLAVGFFLMSRWPVHVNWTQITISTLTAGFGFGLVIAPIGTTAINAVRPAQAGVGSAIVTALRMVGMIFGLAALTSWALAYFKQLAATYSPHPGDGATFVNQVNSYAAFLLQTECTVYDKVFFVSMILCLLAIIPTFFLWGRQQPELSAMSASQTVTRLAASPSPQFAYNASFPQPASRRRLFTALVLSALLLLLAGSGVFAAFFSGTSSGTASTNSGANAASASGSHLIQLAFTKDALTSIFTQQLNLQQGTFSDLNVAPEPRDGLTMSLNLNITIGGLHRVMPIEIDGALGVDQQRNLHITVQHVKRDGNDAGPEAAKNMQTAINGMLSSTLMPTLNKELQGVKIVSAHTSTSISCGRGVEMAVLEIETPPIQGLGTQPTSLPFCFSGPVDLHTLSPN